LLFVAEEEEEKKIPFFIRVRARKTVCKQTWTNVLGSILPPELFFFSFRILKFPKMIRAKKQQHKHKSNFFAPQFLQVFPNNANVVHFATPPLPL
jgi:hypothetical protein